MLRPVISTNWTRATRRFSSSATYQRTNRDDAPSRAAFTLRAVRAFGPAVTIDSEKVLTADEATALVGFPVEASTMSRVRLLGNDATPGSLYRLTCVIETDTLPSQTISQEIAILVAEQ